MNGGKLRILALAAMKTRDFAAKFLRIYAAGNSRRGSVPGNQLLHKSRIISFRDGKVIEDKANAANDAAALLQ